MKNMIDIGDDNFDEVIKMSEEKPVLVDFWASWCMPCRMLGPVLERIAEESEGKFLLAKLNVDSNPVKSSEYGIMSIPSVKMFRKGKVVDEFVGALPESHIKKWLEKHI